MRKNKPTFINKKSCTISSEVQFGKNCIIGPNVTLRGRCKIGDNVKISSSTISSTDIGSDSQIDNCVVTESVIGKYVQCGPFSYLRPKCLILDDCKIGSFVEMKNAQISRGTKVPHLSYVGDAKIGQMCNIGCGVIFANYDGQNKRETIVGDYSFIGANCNLVAPLRLGEGTYVGAGATVTDDTPPHSFVVGRVSPTVKIKVANKYYAKHKKESNV